MTAMRGIWMLAVLAIGGACGGPTKGGTTTTTPTGPVTEAPKSPAADGPTCAEMATKVVATAAAGRGERFQREAPRMTEIVRERCEKDAWSAEIRRCMHSAAERSDATRCFKQLTPEQQQTMEDAEAEMRRSMRGREADADDEAVPAATGAAPPPPPPGAAPTLAPPPAPAKASAPEKDKKEKRKAIPKGGKVNSDPCMGGE
jgi:hypothetical protein